MSVAVGKLAGHPQGLTMVVWKVQSEKAHVLWHDPLWTVRVAVGQTASGDWARTRLARPRRAESASFIVKAWLPGSPGALRCFAKSRRRDGLYVA